jgi:hypothetical protein
MLALRFSVRVLKELQMCENLSLASRILVIIIGSEVSVQVLARDCNIYKDSVLKDLPGLCPGFVFNLSFIFIFDIL